MFWRAKQICVTSSVLEKEVLLYTNKKCHVIPFGINLNDFYASAIQKQPHPFTYGCIKHFEKIYNIDKVVEAYHLLIEKYPRETFKLKLVGDGSEKQKIYKLAEQFGLTNKIEFTNRIEHNQVPMHLNQIDVLLNVSEYESFGVAVAEAMACKIPVIVSNSEGFKDLVPNKDYAIIVSSITPEIICNAMEEYFVNAEKRKSVVKKSYELIIEKFNWINNLKQMEEVYLEFLPNLNPQ